MKTHYKFAFSILISVLFFSCAPKPIPEDHNLVMMEKENVSLDKLGNGTVLFYNDANILHTADATSRLNLLVDGKNVGQLRAKDFVIVYLESGDHVVNLKHWDVVNMRSEHSINVTDSIKVIRVKPTVASNKLEVVNQLPDNWKKYEYLNPNR